jgi:hypothetical protein
VGWKRERADTHTRSGRAGLDNGRLLRAYRRAFLRVREEGVRWEVCIVVVVVGCWVVVVVVDRKDREVVICAVIRPWPFG